MQPETRQLQDHVATSCQHVAREPGSIGICAYLSGARFAVSGLPLCCIAPWAHCMCQLWNNNNGLVEDTGANAQSDAVAKKHAIRMRRLYQKMDNNTYCCFTITLFSFVAVLLLWVFSVIGPTWYI